VDPAQKVLKAPEEGVLPLEQARDLHAEVGGIPAPFLVLPHHAEKGGVYVGLVRKGALHELQIGQSVLHQCCVGRGHGGTTGESGARSTVGERVGRRGEATVPILPGLARVVVHKVSVAPRV
jgi:hypothetical protein